MTLAAASKSWRALDDVDRECGQLTGRNGAQIVGIERGVSPKVAVEVLT
jgi:hypothetical protein